jgi:hypothetical protein
MDTGGLRCEGMMSAVQPRRGEEERKEKEREEERGEGKKGRITKCEDQ